MSNISSNCTLEKDPLAVQAVGTLTGNFLSDYSTMVSYALDNCKNELDIRRKYNMPPEPYSPDYHIYDTHTKLFDRAIKMVGSHLSNLEWLYSELSDDISKYLLLTVLSYRAIGWEYISLPLDNDIFRGFMSKIGKKWLDGPLYLATDHRIELREINLGEFSFNVSLYSDPFGAINEFLYSQYVYRGVDCVYSPNESDVVIDCGACFGGTSLFFADRVGESGQVYSFEFVEQNLQVFKDNINLNPSLDRRIKVVPRPLWSESGLEMYVVGTGPGAAVSCNPSLGGVKFLTYTIDDLARDESLDRVSFIKMDIEGAEMEALKGARETIAKHRPRLAISVYHRFTDFYQVPMYLRSLHSDYRLFFQHSTGHGDESVIFAI